MIVEQCRNVSRGWTAAWVGRSHGRPVYLQCHNAYLTVQVGRQCDTEVVRRDGFYASAVGGLTITVLPIGDDPESEFPTLDEVRELVRDIHVPTSVRDALERSGLSEKEFWPTRGEDAC